MENEIRGKSISKRLILWRMRYGVTPLKTEGPIEGCADVLCPGHHSGGTRSGLLPLKRQEH